MLYKMSLRQPSCDRHTFLVLVMKIIGKAMFYPNLLKLDYWSFYEMEHEFNEFSKFRESDKSLKHELESIEKTCVLLPLWWHSGL